MKTGKRNVYAYILRGEGKLTFSVKIKNNVFFGASTLEIQCPTCAKHIYVRYIR